ncbi:M23 family metallopeptidase [Flavobacterium daejeonense]|uniref:M23 family metallopeptidase n=1 Tax=Flavobacterium daejeonense TaxID=350893 RepID=UPI0012DE4363|nr:M23 family metallopeptidase [Flavobacterium daejeonense]
MEIRTVILMEMEAALVLVQEVVLVQEGGGSTGTGGGSGGGSEGSVTKSTLSSPVGTATISSLFMSTRTCAKCSSTHGGTDYAVPKGTNVLSTASGTVVRSYYSTTYGNTVIVNHGSNQHGSGNVYTLYAHGESRLVAQGQQVDINEVLIKSGNTGLNTTGPHLHYEVIVTTKTPFEPGFFWKFIN